MVGAMNHEAGAILELTQELGAVWLALLAGFLLGWKLRGTYQLVLVGAVGLYGALTVYMAIIGWFGVQTWQSPTITGTPASDADGLIGVMAGWHHETWEWVEGVVYNVLEIGFFALGMVLAHRLGSTWDARHWLFIGGAGLVVLSYGALRVPTLIKTFSEPANLASEYHPDKAGCPKLLWLTPEPARSERPECLWTVTP